jgi:hypothetical protein
MIMLEKDVLSPFVPRIDKIILDKEDKKCTKFNIVKYHENKLSI